MPARARHLALWTLPVVALAAVIWWWGRSGTPPAPEPDPLAEVGPPGTELVATADGPTVFRRAFWRHPTPEDHIVAAERREWVDDAGVAKWQWFLAVDLGAPTMAWLETNPFALQSVEPGTLELGLEAPPGWFPSQLAVARGWQSASGRQRIYIEAKTSRVFATDNGTGMSAPVAAP